jgi:hypothetical protein
MIVSRSRVKRPLTFNVKDNCCFEAGYALPPRECGRERREALRRGAEGFAGGGADLGYRREGDGRSVVQALAGGEPRDGRRRRMGESLDNLRVTPHGRGSRGRSSGGDRSPTVRAPDQRFHNRSGRFVLLQAACQTTAQRILMRTKRHIGKRLRFPFVFRYAAPMDACL